MEKIKFFSDSACDLLHEEVEKNDIGIVPVTVSYEGKSFREYYDMTPQEYWALLRTIDEIPTTAQITPQQMFEFYCRTADEGYTHALGIIINGAGTGCLQSCMIGREMFYEERGHVMEIELIDSETYTYIYGRVLLEACAMRDKGERFADIVQLSRARIRRSEAILGVYSLKFLKKSGRISGAVAFVGEALGLKPVLQVGWGAVSVIDKARGEKNLVPRVLEHVKKRAVHPENQTAVLLYGDLPEARLAEIEKSIRALGFADVIRRPIGISVITNTGPDAFAVMYYGEQRPVD